MTALGPMIGYDKASAIAHKTNDDGLTLKEAALPVRISIVMVGLTRMLYASAPTEAGTPRLLGWGVKR